MTPSRLSRRRMIGLTAGGAAAAVVGTALAHPPGAVADGQDPVEDPVDVLGVASQVTEVHQGGVTAEPLDPADGPQAATWGIVPIVGFPAGVAPREGDHVTVRDGLDGYDLAAVPLCRWHEGIPQATPAGHYTVAGHVTVPVDDIIGSARTVLDHAHTNGQTVYACLLDTDEDHAFVLDVRTSRATPVTG